ncbi:hypothetical protein [Curtobacterium sp. MCBA15_004]|uniref:hypothetical protein n=1 Tax=Curtobacterium sp. MCBA15_004 TaxID=1898733 RepID=UPI0008DCD42F|nr:hypothetical protein [Curtobacterium sp. MCBA15_004]WIA97023.1 hypothetical protein QOL16_01140 [Curtobacterium sp. MCBA15_004]
MTESDETLFTEHPATARSGLIQYNEFLMNERLVAVGYADAARRLRASFTNQPWDDVMLLPFLFLWRQAIELELKANIRDLATIRRRDGEGDADLKREAVNARLKNPQKVGHKLTKLVHELGEHSSALKLEELPESIARVLQLLAAMGDGALVSDMRAFFKFPARTVDFYGLAEALDDVYQLLEVIVDAATNGEGV